MITKIVTARDTSFSVGHIGKEGGRIVDIINATTTTPPKRAYKVYTDDDRIVYVYDVVEEWTTT